MADLQLPPREPPPPLDRRAVHAAFAAAVRIAAAELRQRGEDPRRVFEALDAGLYEHYRGLALGRRHRRLGAVAERLGQLRRRGREGAES